MHLVARPGGPARGCENAAIADLLDKRLVFVTGKGGVGKTTIAYALGLAAAGRGKRVIVCELASQERGSALFGRDSIGFEESELGEDLWAISIDPDRVTREYLELQLPVRAMGELLHRSRIFSYLAAATPGLREMVTMGKVWELAQDRRRIVGADRTYELVIVDAPATGHGIGFLQTPRNFAEIARVGPLARQATAIQRTLEDHSETGVAIVATPEEMAVTEALTIGEQLDAEGFAIDRVFVNALYPERFSAAELERIAGARRAAAAAAQPALDAALEESRRAAAQREQIARLRPRQGPAPVELPFIFAPRIGAAELGRLVPSLP